MFGPYMHASPNMNLTSDIAKAIDGEYTAVLCYEQLAKMAPSEEARKQILEIRNDEIRHFQMFSKLYTSMTGRQHTPKLNEPCPGSYLEGVRSSFKDEQETVDAYLDIFDRAHDPHIKHEFSRAAADEQNHAVWFLYFLKENAHEGK